MINKLRIQGFKSWEDTGDIRLGRLTGFFGANSSGKTALLQYLLMLKQTVESADRARVLNTGGTYVDLGTFYYITHKHMLPAELRAEVRWVLDQPLRVLDPEGAGSARLFAVSEIAYQSAIAVDAASVRIREFSYAFDDHGQSYRFGMIVREGVSSDRPWTYDLIREGYDLKRNPGRPWPLPAPVKSYGFPDRVNADYQNAGFLSELVLAFEELFQNVYYLGPLREYPHRSYVWTGDSPQDVGQRGEQAVPALLAARKRGKHISPGYKRHRQTVEQRVAYWLKELKLIESFELRQISDNRNEYELRVRCSKGAAEVLMVILEQPEIHLHPMVQAGLADVFIDAIQNRHVQIILESHSEHLLRRLQRRIAEGALDAEDTALYFVGMEDGTSYLERLALDLFGNIQNWPPDFFGDEMGDLVAQAEAEMLRRRAQEETVG